MKNAKNTGIEHLYQADNSISAIWASLDSLEEPTEKQKKARDDIERCLKAVRSAIYKLDNSGIQMLPGYER